MRTLCILTFICIVVTYAIPNDERSDPKAVACAKELNFDMDVMNQLAKDKSLKPPEEFYCVISCMMTKQIKGYKNTIYEFLMELIKQVDERNGIKNKSYTREDLENTLNGCNSKGLNECDFMKCIKFLEPPISDVLGMY